jgi:hypothetical protein
VRQREQGIIAIAGFIALVAVLAVEGAVLIAPPRDARSDAWRSPQTYSQTIWRLFSRER